jgi:hypothetical protein
VRNVANLDHSHHFFRHIKKSWTDGDFIEPAAFRLREENGQFEKGLSVNWLEYFQTPTPQDAIAPLRDILISKGRTVGGQSKFALLNVGAAKDAAVKYIPVAIVLAEEPNDPSHSLVKGYEAYNDQVAEELAKVIIATFPAQS